MLHLGPYSLEQEIGRGGMGVVFSARHVAHGVRVAVKVLTLEGRVEDPEFIAGFKQEARAAGRLHHPAICAVLDYGTISEELGRSSESALSAGSPYLVMEWLSGATLEQARPSSYDELVGVLLTLLDGLAHAHARGVLHRDLKAANVVLGEDGAARLIDFGIARLDAPDDRDEQLAGTAMSMAPEQILPGLRRDQGPWTDLYGLGCLAYQLAAGRAPFMRDSLVAVLADHLETDPPPLEPQLAVPDGFEGWVRRLLEKAPRARFRCAADAARALEALGSVERESASDEGKRPVAPIAFGDTLAAVLEPGTEPTLAAQPAAPSAPFAVTIPAPAAVAPPSARPRFPRTWRRGTRVSGAPTGTGIFGMRTIPMVDRNGERDAVFGALRRAVEAGGVEVVSLRGPAGCGKSRVAQWMMERADELGCATGLTAWHGPTPSELGGPTGMLARHLSCTGLDWAGMQSRIQHVLSPLGATHAQQQAVAEVLRGISRDHEATAPRGSFTSDQERVAVCADVLSVLARERPLFVWLDDVQWGLEALQLVRRMLDASRVSVLMVLTVREEALAERPAEAAALNALEEEARVMRVDVGPLGEVDSRQLVESMLGLAPEIAERVVARSRGNPLFAVELVGDLVDRGRLALDASGHYGLSETARDEPLALADDIHEVWGRRIQLFLSTQADGASEALEIAAVLGQEVAIEVWTAVCAEAGVSPSPELLEELLHHDLAVDVEDGFRFVHGLLREALEQSARDRGVLAAHHAACARTLAATPRPDPERLARIAYHALGASDVQGAASALFSATHEAERRGQHARVARYVERLVSLFEQHEALRSDRGRTELLYARALRRRDAHPDEAAKMFEDARARAEKGGYELLLARVLTALYRHHHRGAESKTVAAYPAQAVTLFRRHGAFADAVACLHQASRDALERNAVDDARAMLEQMQRLAAISDDPLCLAECLDRESDLLRQAGETERALAASEAATAGFEEMGCLARAADTLNAKAEIQWLNVRDLEAAAETMREGISRQDALGNRRMSYWPRYNLAAVELQRGGVERARELIQWLDANTDELRYQTVRHLIHLMQASLAAYDGDWAAWDQHMAPALAGDLDEALVEEDVIIWRRAAELAEAGGRSERARVARTRADDIAARLER